MINVSISRKKIEVFCKKYHISRFALFGSVLRNDFSPESDIDVIVEFEKGHTPGFFHLFEMEEELSTFVSGRKVEIRTPEDLSPYFRDDVLRDMRVEYAQE